MFVFRQERTSIAAPSNHLSSPNSVVALSPSLAPSTCLSDASTNDSSGDMDQPQAPGGFSSIYLLSNTTAGSNSEDSLQANTSSLAGDSNAGNVDQQGVELSPTSSPEQATQDSTETADSNNTAAATANLVSLEEMSGSALRVRVQLPLPPAPEFLRVRWNASLSSSASAVVTGALNSPGIVFYAVRHRPYLCEAVLSPFMFNCCVRFIVCSDVTKGHSGV